VRKGSFQLPALGLSLFVSGGLPLGSDAGEGDLLSSREMQRFDPGQSKRETARNWNLSAKSQ
jgi:hypothetical protein